MLRTVLAAVVLASALLGVSCGGGNLYSCDVTAGSTHVCLEYSWTGGYDSAVLSTACSVQGGTAGTTCSRNGAVGGCRVVTTAGGSALTTITWQYSGTASTNQAGCEATGGTFVSP